MVEPVSIRPRYQVGRVRDYSEAQEVELLHQPQQIVVLPARTLLFVIRTETREQCRILYLLPRIRSIVNHM